MENLDFVVIDDTKQDHWAEWKEIVKSERFKLRHIQYTYFFSCITQCERVDVTKFLVEEIEKKRHIVESSLDHVKRLRANPEVVTLDSDDDADSDDDDIQILEQKLLNRKNDKASRVYIEKSSKLDTSCELIDLGDTDEESSQAQREGEEREFYKNAGLSVGLQQAISALQQKPRPVSRKSKSPDKKIIPSDPESKSKEDSASDEIEVLVEKEAPKDKSSRKEKVVDRKAIMFQTGLKNLLNQDLEADDKSKSSVEEDSRTEAEGAAVTEGSAVTAVEVLSPTQPFPSLKMEEWEEEEGNLRKLCRVLDCVLDRQNQTGETVTVGLVTSRTCQYLKSKSGRVGAVPRQVDSSVREEFYQKYQDRREEEDQSLVSEMNQVSNILSSLKFLESYTSHLTHPTPAIINNLMASCLLAQQSMLVAERTVDYLEVTVYRFLSCVSSNVMTYQEWLEIILSACRAGNNINFTSFSLANPRDTVGCQAFFKQLMEEFSSRSGGGSNLLAEFIVWLCERDLGLWWKYHKHSCQPVLFYLLGDSPATLLSTLKSVLAPTYRSLLIAPYSQRLTVVRKLFSMSSIILAHLDSVNKQSYINLGSKLDLAGVMAEALAQWYKRDKSSQSLSCELMLLQPDWFSLLVARKLLALLTSGKMSGLSSLTDLTAALGRLSVEEREGGQGMCVEFLQYRAISCCHLHTALRDVSPLVLTISVQLFLPQLLFLNFILSNCYYKISYHFPYINPTIT